MTREAFERLVMQAIGTASMAWTEAPTGVFDSRKCAELSATVMRAFDEAMQEAQQGLLPCAVAPDRARMFDGIEIGEKVYVAIGHGDDALHIGPFAGIENGVVILDHGGLKKRLWVDDVMRVMVMRQVEE